MHEVANCPHRRFSEWLTFGHVRFRTDSERLAGVERLAIFAHVDSTMMLGDSRETDPPLPSCAYLRFLPISYCQFRWFDSCKLLSLTASVWTLQAQTQCRLSALGSSRGGAEVWCCCVDWKGSGATTSRFKKSTLSSRIGFFVFDMDFHCLFEFIFFGHIWHLFVFICLHLCSRSQFELSIAWCRQWVAQRMPCGQTAVTKLRTTIKFKLIPFVFPTFSQ